MLLPHSLYVITGANRGFGQAIANAIAAKASHTTTMILVGRQQASLDNVANRIIQKNEKIITHVISNVSLDSAMTAQETILKPLETIVTVSFFFFVCMEFLFLFLSSLVTINK